MNIESKLFFALKSGNSTKIEKVFEEIYESYYKLLYFCAGTFLNQKEDIEDVVIDTFLSFFNNLKSIKIDGSVKNYLVRSVKNKAINLAKKKREILVDNIEEYSLEYENANLKDDLMEVIKRNLDEDELDLFLNHVIEDISLRKLSVMRKENINTTKSKYRRIRDKLREILEGDLWEKRKLLIN